MSSPSIKSFRYDKLPEVYYQMRQIIDKKLNEASSVTLIADIWTNKIYANFIGLAAVIVNALQERELVVIGMKSMDGDHTAENVQRNLEEIINEYKCNKANMN